MALSLRAASGGQLGATTPTSQVITLPTGTAQHDIVYFIVSINPPSGTVSAPVCAGWNPILVTNATAVMATIVGYRTIQAGDTNPTVTWTTAGKVSWTAIALQPASGTRAAHHGFGTVLNAGTAATNRVPNTYPAGAAVGVSVLLHGLKRNDNLATGLTTVPPTNGWVEPTNGDQTTATGTTATTRQIAAEVAYVIGGTGTVTPTATTQSASSFAIIHHAFAIEENIPEAALLGTEDVSTPPVAYRALSTATAVTSNSFTPPAGSTLVAVVTVAWSSAPGTTPALTASDSVAGTWTTGTTIKTGGVQSAIYYRYLASAPGPITVTITSADATNKAMVLAVRVLPGADPVQTGAGSGTSASVMSVSVPVARTGSTVYVAAGANANQGAEARLANTTALGFWVNTAVGNDLAVGRAAAITAATGATTYGWTPGHTSAALEILAAPAAATSLPQPVININQMALRRAAYY